jgi:hypothetical protein
MAVRSPVHHALVSSLMPAETPAPENVPATRVSYAEVEDHLPGWSESITRRAVSVGEA